MSKPDKTEDDGSVLVNRPEPFLQLFDIRNTLLTLYLHPPYSLRHSYPTTKEFFKLYHNVPGC